MNQERTVQFILDNLAALTASQQHAEARAARQIKGIQTLMGTGMKLIVRLEKGQKRTDKALADLVAAQKRTDLKFDRLLDALNKGSNGHNGHKKH